jgi:hypothetical protein
MADFGAQVHSDRKNSMIQAGNLAGSMKFDGKHQVSIYS